VQNVIASVWRGEQMESSHLGHVAVVDASGTLLYSYGNPHRPTFARSTWKPLQAIPVVETGAADRLGFDASNLAICCGSHNGEQNQCDCALKILDKVGLTEAELHCGPDKPYLDEDYQKLILAHKRLSPIYSNCSGKHAGMLATAVHQQEDVSTYTHLTHPVQQRILRVISEMTDVPAEQIYVGIDGCSAPTHQVPLANLALSYARLAQPDGLPAPRRAAIERIVAAMLKHPEMVGGHQRYTTHLMKAYAGRLIGKDGAEGVFCIGDLQHGLGIAIKIEDGNKNVIQAVVNAILRQLGFDLGGPFEQLQDYTEPPIENKAKQVVGQIRTDFQLQKH